MSPKSRGTPVPTCLQSKSTPDRTAPRTPADDFSHERSHERSHEPNLHVISTSSAPQASIVDQDDALLETEDSESSESDDEDDAPRIQRRLHTSRSHNHLPHATSTLFPPFYNRPPVPLPPSPSLTSLLRPSFSTTTSRRTTPDSSDVDIASTVATGTSSTSNLASITKSARHAPLVPRASPKVPTYEYYGFALYLASSAAFLLYIIWAYVPSPLLHQMGIHYYPNRWWALAVPCWLVALVIYIYVALASYNTQHLTLPMSSCENLVDETAQMALINKRDGRIVRAGSSQGRGNGDTRAASVAGSRADTISVHQFSPGQEVDWKSFWSISTDAVMDVPIGGVCEVLYGDAEDD